MDEIPPYTSDMKNVYLMDQIFGLGTIKAQNKSKSKRGSIIFRKKTPRKTVDNQTQSMDFDLIRKADSALTITNKSGSATAKPEDSTGGIGARKFERERAK